MFKRRLKKLLACLTAAAAVIVVRLIDLQVVRADQFAQRAAEALVRPTRLLPAVRGRILDRRGRVLAMDEPRWDVCLYYPLLSDTQGYVSRLAASRARRAGTDPSKLQQRIYRQIELMWQTIEQLTAAQRSLLQQRRAEVVRRVAAIRARVSRYHNVDIDVQEQRMFHPLVRGLDDETALQLRLALDGLPWVEIRVANRRYYPRAEALCHLLGWLGQVPAKVAYDPSNLEADVLEQYLPGELMGIRGVERLGERLLRGRRGLIRQDIYGRVVQRIEPRPGRDLVLTIDAQLQERIVRRLAEAVESNQPAVGSGAAAVVLDVPTRQVLALASYPTFDPNSRRQRYKQLAADRRAPLLFRAVSGTYPAGSIVKPMVLAAALSLGLVSPDEQKLCTGRLLPGVDAWHCWTYWRHLPPHGWVDARQAIQHSCNVYFFKIAQDVGAERLTRWFERFGLGRRPGTGLIEERPGIVPTAAWLERHRSRGFRPGDARNLAIGQGELTITPLQAANIAATIASGRWLPPTLLMQDWRDRPMLILDVSESDWSVIREGMYRVVNEPGGTAYRTARLAGLELCGKTGSAETGQADQPTHAWFIGFAPYRHPRVAVAVLIEHSGSGGSVAAPVAKDIVQMLLDSDGGYLLARRGPVPDAAGL